MSNPQSNRSLNVMLLHSVLGNRGIERMLLWFGLFLPRDRYRVRVCILRDVVEMAERFHQQRVPIDLLGMKGVLDPCGALRLLRILKQHKIDILHIHGYRAAVIGRPIARLAGVPVVIYSVHNRWGGEFHFFFDRLTAPFSDGVFPFSEGVRHFLLDEVRIPPKHLKETIYIGIELDRWCPVDHEALQAKRAELGIPSNAQVLMSVGALSEQKGLEYSLRAVSQMTGEYPALRYLIVGDGPLREPLEALAQGLGLADHVHFLGARDDVPELMNLSDILVLPSLWEGLPQVAVEAMAASTPVVASGVDGVPEVVQDGVTGILIPPRGEAALRTALSSLLRDPKLRARMGQAGRLRAEQEFSVERMIERYDRVYQDYWHRARGENGK